VHTDAGAAQLLEARGVTLGHSRAEANRVLSGRANHGLLALRQALPRGTGRHDRVGALEPERREQRRWYDDMQQASSSGDMAARLWRSRTQIEISNTARRITQPALVVHARQDRAVPYEEGRRLASLSPDARFVTLESDNHNLQEGEPAWEAFLSDRD
jgi:pimeloyl-ACP methyl ester carboxylesterase